MKKLFFFTPIILLIFATTLTKNTTKKLDKEIFQLRESISILEDRYELTLLDYSILTSPNGVSTLLFRRQIYSKEN